MSTLVKRIISSAILSILLLIGLEVQAQIDKNVWSDNPKIDEIFWNGQQQDFSNNTGLGENNPFTIITNIINIGMGFVGITMVVMFMLAGFKLMLAGGNEDKLVKAQKSIWSTVVGSLLLMSSFGIAKFLIGTVASATGIY